MATLVPSVAQAEPLVEAAAEDRSGEDWSYEEAFSRNLGLVNETEQQRLKECRVAIAGQGGVGGIHLVTLARLGIGRFTIADPDHFETANFNRQFGSKVENLGRAKVDVTAAEARGINPEAEIRVMREAITEENVDEFLDGADVFVDGIDFFNLEARRLVFREARRRGIWALTAGPIGFSTAWLVFDPQGMSFEDYFDLDEGMDPLEEIAALGIGLAPQATHRTYLDFDRVKLKAARGPSVGFACHLASGVVAAEIIKIVLGRGRVRAAPCYSQFDAYRGVLRQGRLRWGNRGPLQRLKRHVLRRILARAN